MDASIFLSYSSCNNLLKLQIKVNKEKVQAYVSGEYVFDLKRRGIKSQKNVRISSSHDGTSSNPIHLQENHRACVQFIMR